MVQAGGAGAGPETWRGSARGAWRACRHAAERPGRERGLRREAPARAYLSGARGPAGSSTDLSVPQGQAGKKSASLGPLSGRRPRGEGDGGPGRGKAAQEAVSRYRGSPRKQGGAARGHAAGAAGGRGGGGRSGSAGGGDRARRVFADGAQGGPMAGAKSGVALREGDRARMRGLEGLAFLLEPLEASSPAGAPPASGAVPADSGGASPEQSFEEAPPRASRRAAHEPLPMGFWPTSAGAGLFRSGRRG
jgi:hypothetical protein